MPGFARKFVISRLVKSILLVPIFPSLFFVLRLRRVNTILYRPDARHLQLFEKKRSLLVIGTAKDADWAKEKNFDFFYFHPFYALANLGFSFCWKLLFYVTKPKRVLIWTDYGLDQFLANSCAKRLNIKVWCYQHGLFPSSNHGDLDGMDVDLNVVSSPYQAKIMKAAGFLGNIKVCTSLFANSGGEQSRSDWIDKGRPVIFVGPGFSHDQMVEDNLIVLMEKLKKLLGQEYSLVYRPHPRDRSIFHKLNKLGVPSISDETTYFSNSSALVYIGVKSTLLIEAQNAGRLVILLTSEKFPKYFESGEIFHEFDSDNLGEVLTLLNKLENDSLP